MLWIVLLAISYAIYWVIKTVLNGAGNAVASLGDGSLTGTEGWALHHTSALRCMEGGHYDDALQHLFEARRLAAGLPGVVLDIDKTEARVHDALCEDAMSRGDGHLARTHRVMAAEIRGGGGSMSVSS